jgi:hypothetical protein
MGSQHEGAASITSILAEAHERLRRPKPALWLVWADFDIFPTYHPLKAR